MNIDFQSESAIQSANISDSKCKNCTLEELAIINELIKNPNITQKELASGRCLWKYKETYLSIRHQSKPVISCGDGVSFVH